jgi:hypothetical protein
MSGGLLQLVGNLVPSYSRRSFTRPWITSTPDRSPPSSPRRPRCPKSMQVTTAATPPRTPRHAPYGALPVSHYTSGDPRTKHALCYLANHTLCLIDSNCGTASEEHAHDAVNAARSSHLPPAMPIYTESVSRAHVLNSGHSPNQGHSPAQRQYIRPALRVDCPPAPQHWDLASRDSDLGVSLRTANAPHQGSLCPATPSRQ